MKISFKILLPSIFTFSILLSCVPNINEETSDNNQSAIEPLDIPSGFDFKTHQKVSITINDALDVVKYDIFTHSETPVYKGTETFTDLDGNEITEEVYVDDIVNKPVFTGATKNGQLKVDLTLPVYATKVYVRRRENFKYSGQLVNVINDKVSYNHAKSSDKLFFEKSAAVSDILYCVNDKGEFFQIDLSNGEYTFISEMPSGSYTIALDQKNLVLYAVARIKPYPLMKFDIRTEVWSTIGNVGEKGYRLGFNKNDNLLYYSDQDDVMTINPSNALILNKWDVNGLDNKNDGDLTFADDGTFYMASKSGLYTLTFNGSSYNATKVNTTDLQYQPTSLAIDSNGDFWFADNTGNSNLVVMNHLTGNWEYAYGDVKRNGTEFGRKIEDIALYRVTTNNPQEPDTDGDGIVDSEDAYPNDNNKAFQIFTPSETGTGSITFEDLWPSYGDYDFNDVALNYKAITILNSNNRVVQVDFICYVKANGAGFTNGFGIEIEGVPSALVESVTGTNLTEDYINLNANGTEANQQNAVIIFTDNQDNFLNETTVSIKFTQPISTEQLGTVPFNPFIIKNSVRAHEIHLPYYNTTDLGEKNVTISGANRDIDGNYISDIGYPWAISIIHDFKVPKENVKIDNAYNYFKGWANSGGKNFSDWFKDKPGYRNANKLGN